MSRSVCTSIPRPSLSKPPSNYSQKPPNGPACLHCYSLGSVLPTGAKAIFYKLNQTMILSLLKPSKGFPVHFEKIPFSLCKVLPYPRRSGLAHFSLWLYLLESLGHLSDPQTLQYPVCLGTQCSLPGRLHLHIFMWLFLLFSCWLKYHLVRDHPPQRPLPITLPCFAI